MAIEFRSGDALFVFDADMTVLSWNHAAEELTGIRSEDAVGRTCWDVLGGVDEHGSVVCHAGCSGARLAGDGWPVHCQRLLVKTAGGTRKDVWVSTIAVQNGDGPLYVHVLRDGGGTQPEPPPRHTQRYPARLTRRQLQVLELIDQGLPAKTIAARLRIAEPTVRNHIRSILLELGCHSQLEALAAARRRGLL